MNGDQPSTTDVSPRAGLQLKVIVAEEIAMFAGDECSCAEEEVCYPLSVAKAALQTSRVSPVGALAFRRALTRLACRQKSSVSLPDFQTLLSEFAFQKIWGRGFDKTLAQAVAEDLANEFHFRPGDEPLELLDVCLRYVDQAVGRLGRSVGRNGNQLVAYDPTKGAHPDHRPSLWGFVKYRARRDARRAFQKLYEHVDVSSARHPNLEVPRDGASEVRVTAVQRAIQDAGDLVHSTQSNESRLLDLLEEYLDAAAPGRPALGRNLRKTIHIIRCAVRGEAGYCIRLESGVGATSDASPLLLGTSPTTDVAELHGSKNPTVLRKQLAGWIRILLAGVAADPARALEARSRVHGSLKPRRAAYELLEAITPLVAGLNPKKADKYAKLWRGFPKRDQHDGMSGGSHDIGGVGIASIPFLFGLNPLGEDLLQLFGPLHGGDAGPEPLL